MPLSKKSLPYRRAATLIGSLVVCIALASACPAASEHLRQYIDEVTAASVTVSTETLIFARERTDLAVNARDYITLVPVEINRSGTRNLFWSGYLWSTIDRRNSEPLLTQGDELVLLADGRPLPLRRDGKTLRDHGAGQPITSSPGHSAVAVLFSASGEEISYVSRAKEVHIELIHAGANEKFALWKGKPRRLTEFAASVSP